MNTSKYYLKVNDGVFKYKQSYMHKCTGIFV